MANHVLNSLSLQLPDHGTNHLPRLKYETLLGKDDFRLLKIHAYNYRSEIINGTLINTELETNGCPRYTAISYE
jgi:hypothetical protein